MILSTSLASGESLYINNDNDARRCNDPMKPLNGCKLNNYV